ncbi:MAG: ribosome maturation factor RimP [Pseudomonadota bacterium]
MIDFVTLIEPTLEGLGYELVEVDYLVKTRMLRVFIDRPEGITLDDCTKVSHHLGRVFMVEELDYSRLEVSSPGLDRPLTRPAHFKRFVGSPVKIKLRRALNQRKLFTGVLEAYDEEHQRLRLNTEDLGQLEFEMSEIERVRLIPVFKAEKQR